jgi:DNA-binding NtrC family response regulator
VLESYPFPGNVRELENIVRGAARKAPDGVVYAVDLCSYMELAEEGAVSGWESPDRSVSSNQVTPADSPADESLEEQVHRFKLSIVKETLARHQGNATRAARALKISRPSLYKLLRDMKREDVNALGAERELALAHDREGQCILSAGVG